MCKSESIQSVTGTSDAEKSEVISDKVNFDEAIRLAAYGKFNYFIVIISGIVLSAVLLETLSISFVLPVAEKDLNLSTEDKGIVSSVAYAGIIASSHLSGFLADTKGRRLVIMLSLLLSFGCTLISSFVNNFWIFTAMRFFCGFFISGSSATIYAYLAEFHTIKMQSKVIMGAAFVFGVCSMCMPLIAMLIINQEWIFVIDFLNVEYKPWRLFVLSCGSLSLISGLCFVFLPESPKFAFNNGKKEEALNTLRKIYRLNTGRPAEEYKVKEIVVDDKNNESSETDSKDLSLWKRMWNQTAPLFQKIHLKNTLILCSIQFLIFNTSSGFYMFFPEILNRAIEFSNQNPNASCTICEAFYENRNSSIAEVNPSSIIKLEFKTYEYSFILEIIYALGFAVIGILVNRLGKLFIVLFVLLGCGLCGFAISFVSIVNLSIYLYVILLACGLSVNVITGSTLELFPTSLRAMAVSLSLMCGRLGSVFGSLVVGLLLDKYCKYAFLYSGTTLIICCCLIFFIPNISNRRGKKSCDNKEISPI
ncbi:synaptic vesicle glycoprotein 2B-like [Chironomus tepperi]|uniref:synaptic vesicle glycoprotein 2B-like n=1 Tax=Chironomus tepperi TaxID=113505 RepID=UPI00391FB418